MLYNLRHPLANPISICMEQVFRPKQRQDVKTWGYTDNPCHVKMLFLLTIFRHGGFSTGGKRKGRFEALSNRDPAVERQNAFSLGFLKLIVHESCSRMS